MLKVSKADRFGRFTLQVEQQLIIARVEGVCGQQLAAEFSTAMQRIITSADLGYWAYLGDLSHLQGFNQEALQELLPAHEFARQHGCVADAYCLNGFLTKSQIAHIRQQAGIHTALDPLVFSQPQSAKVHLQQQLLALGIGAAPP